MHHWLKFCQKYFAKNSRTRKAELWSFKLSVFLSSNDTYCRTCFTIDFKQITCSCSINYSFYDNTVKLTHVLSPEVCDSIIHLQRQFYCNILSLFPEYVLLYLSRSVQIYLLEWVYRRMCKKGKMKDSKYPVIKKKNTFSGPQVFVLHFQCDLLPYIVKCYIK